MKEEKRHLKKIMKRIAIGLVAGIVAVVAIAAFVFRKELKTMIHMNKVNSHPFYEMTYYADYGLEELAKQGVGSDDALVDFVTKRLLKGLPITANVDGACSAFNVQTPEGDYVMARNFDYHPSTAMLVKTNPKDGYRSISMVNLTHIGYNQDKQPDTLFHKVTALAAPYIPLDGMNEKGFFIGVLVVKEQIVHQNTGKTPITTTSAIRLLLDRATNVDEAVEILSNYDMNSTGDTGYHFFLSDANGKSAVVEYIDHEMKVIYNTKDTKYLATTNFTLSTKEQNGVGKDRYEIIQTGLGKNNGIMTEEATMQLLEDAKFDGIIASGGNENDPYYDCSTQWSAVYNLTKKTVSICIGADYSKVYEYSLEYKQRSIKRG
ncbi:MAG: C45 family autoproteolytic acyltransferase/hydrolase [Clostridiales bacterium]|nr:C45 family autoproteolytic acyltransferase/hydrolase [Clostridiales bacterium]